MAIKRNCVIHIFISMHICLFCEFCDGAKWGFALNNETDSVKTAHQENHFCVQRTKSESEQSLTLNGNWKKKRTRCRAKSGNTPAENTWWGAVGVDSASLLIPPASSQHGRCTKVQKGQSGVLWSELRSQPLPPPPILLLHNVPVVVVRQPTFGGGVVSVLTDWREAGGESPTRRAPRSRSALLQRQHTQRCRLRRRQQEELTKS